MALEAREQKLLIAWSRSCRSKSAFNWRLQLTVYWSVPCATGYCSRTKVLECSLSILIFLSADLRNNFFSFVLWRIEVIKGQRGRWNLVVLAGRRGFKTGTFQVYFRPMLSNWRRPPPCAISVLRKYAKQIKRDPSSCGVWCHLGLLVITAMIDI